jgi:hypothetical protein
VARIVADQIIAAPPQIVWDAVTDWDAQSQWVLATTVVSGRGDGHGVGGQLEAITGFGRFGVRDPMTVTEWDPPWRCVVEHRGDVVRGQGIIEVVALPASRSRLVWIEDLALPLGVVGRLGWPLARPMTMWGFRRSLRRFAGLVEAGSLHQTTAQT